MIDLFGHVFYAAITLGILWLGQHKARGWIMKAIGDAGWVILGALLGMSSIIVWASFFVLLDIIGWLQWRSENKPKQFIDELGL